MQNNNFIDNKSKAYYIKLFLFPYYPHKFLRSVRFLAFLAILFALRIIFGYISIPLPFIGKNISFALVPTMLMGWFFGPIHGIFLGAISDTMTFALFPSSVWFWLYAIQEPVYGFLGGISRGLLDWRSKKKTNSYLFDFLYQQFSLMIFIVISLTSIFAWINDGDKLEYFIIYKWLVIFLSIVFIIIMECVSIYYIKLLDLNKDRDKVLTFIYSSTLVCIVIIVFSFLLGPISAIEYWKYTHNGAAPSAFLKYGILYYLIPRVGIECIKTPLEILLFCPLILIGKSYFNNMLNTIDNRW